MNLKRHFTSYTLYLKYLLWCRVRHLLNVHTASWTAHHHGALVTTVHHYGKVRLPGDVQRLGNHHFMYQHTVSCRLLGLELVANHLLCESTNGVQANRRE